MAYPRIFEAATLRELATLPLPPARVKRSRGLAFAPKGRTLARGVGMDVELWDLSALPPRRKAVLEGHTNAVRLLAFLRDGVTLVSADHEEFIFWDLSGPAPRKRRTLTRQVGANEYEREAISPDGRFLVVEDRRHGYPALLWRLSEDAPRPIRLPEARPPFAFTPDGRKLITDSVGWPGQLIIWDLTRPGRRAAVIPWNGGLLRGADVSPDGALLATAAADDKLCLWPLSAAGRERLKLGPRETHRMYRLPPRVGRVRFASDGRTLVLGCGELLRLWDVDRQTELLPPRGHRATVRTVAFAPDGAGLATGGADGTLRLWGLTGAAPAEQALIAAEKRRPTDGPETILSVAFSSDGRSLAGVLGNDHFVSLWDLAGPKPAKVARVPVTARPGAVGSCFFSPDGKTFVTLGYDPNPDKREPTLDDEEKGIRDPDQLPAIRLWDWSGGEIRERQLIRPDHPLLRKGVSIYASHGAFSPDGRQLAAVVWADVHVYRQAGGAFREWACIRQGSDTATGCRAAFSADGRSLLVATHHNPDRDKPGYLDLRSWDLSGKGPRGRAIFRATEGIDAWDLKVSPDGRLIALATRDGRLRVWDARTEKLTREWKLPGSVWGLSFAPDSRHLATANANGTAFVFRLRPPTPRAKAK